MIALEILIRLKEKPPVKNDNFNRDSSAILSRGGYVIHSGIHRSTAFINPAEHAESFAACRFWTSVSQPATNGFVETIIDGGTVELAEFEACKRALPDWKLERGKGQGTQGNSGVTAFRQSGRGVERVGGVDCRDIVTRILSASDCQRVQWRKPFQYSDCQLAQRRKLPN